MADLLGKHEETIKRWIRSDKFPNAYRNSDKEGWGVIESDLLKLNKVFPVSGGEQKSIIKPVDETELAKLAYQTFTLTLPSDEMLSILSVVGIKRTLEILLIIQQAPSTVKNPDGFQISHKPDKSLFANLIM
ncbi:hypothetical protein ACIQ1D_01940 [Lysinibacillus xylanilyticus]|uniref:hypothetical protein n=1 Tax=Lysinibacillus xylanilyticus TaxID=582475 RepID=UPI0038197CDB